MSATLKMAFRLHAGAAALKLDTRQAVLDRRSQDGGFRGRRGGSELWYTDFAIRALDLCGGTPPRVLAGVRDWLQSLPPPGRPVEFLNQNALRRRLRLPRLGPARPSGVSAYETFCWAMAASLAGTRIRPADVGLLLDLRRDGGFAEHPAGRLAQANATAAAIVSLRLAGCLDGGVREAASGFLAGLQGADGGVRAHGEAGAGDLLSSFTAYWALSFTDAEGRLRPGDLGRFVAGLRLPDGGFAAAAGDLESDPEYAFYGVGLLSLLRHRAGVGWPVRMRAAWSLR